MKTENLSKIAEYINQFTFENNGKPPTLTDISKYMGMVKSTAYRHILELNNRGVIEYSGKNTLKSKNYCEDKVDFSRTVILGAIPCGEPWDYREEIQGYVALPKEWIAGECYLLKTEGDSMVDVGIDEGDYVLVKKTDDAHDGQLVVALTETGTTLKRLVTNKEGRPVLRAENRMYNDEKRYIYPHSIKILGVVLKIIKNIE